MKQPPLSIATGLGRIDQEEFSISAEGQKSRAYMSYDDNTKHAE